MSEHENRICTTRAGSLPRPPHLRKLLAAGFAGRGAGQGAAAAELAEARAVVKRQLDNGIDVVNNGEQGRESFFIGDQPFIGGAEPSIADLRLARTLEFLDLIDDALPAWAKSYISAMKAKLGAAYTEPAADVRGYIEYMKSR